MIRIEVSEYAHSWELLVQEGGGPVTAAATACAQAIGTAAAIAITNVTAKGTVKGIYCKAHMIFPSPN
jgi:hypothetical protein